MDRIDTVERKYCNNAVLGFNNLSIQCHIEPGTGKDYNVSVYL